MKLCECRSSSDCRNEFQKRAWKEHKKAGGGGVSEAGVEHWMANYEVDE
jgi:hypothetical protein